MSLQSRLSALISAIGADIKALQQANPLMSSGTRAEMKLTNNPAAGSRKRKVEARVTDDGGSVILTKLIYGSDGVSDFALSDHVHSPARLRLDRGGTTPINNTQITDFPWDSAPVEVGGDWWDAGTPRRIIIPADGFFLFVGGILFTNGTDNGGIWIADFNNSGVRYFEFGGKGGFCPILGMREFSAGKQLQVYGYQASGGATAFGGASDHHAHLSVIQLA